MFRNPVTDVIVVLVIVLLIMGPKRLPPLGKGLGHGMREFKEGITGQSDAGSPSSLRSTKRLRCPPAMLERRPDHAAATPTAPADSQ